MELGTGVGDEIEWRVLRHRDENRETLPTKSACTLATPKSPFSLVGCIAIGSRVGNDPSIGRGPFAKVGPLPP
jgi:hypothetical protein